MNDTLHPCESRIEDISLLAAGCLTEREERELLDHFAACSACRVRYEELISVCSDLKAAKPTVQADFSLTFERKPLGPALRRSAPQGDELPRVLRLAVLVAGVLLMVSVGQRIARRPDAGHSAGRQEVVRQTPTDDEPSVSQAESQPTLLALRRAAAESDESLDRMLARYSVTSESDSSAAQSLWSSRTEL